MDLPANISLRVLEQYKAVPNTSGCEKCTEINGGNKDWCCKKHNPSMFYVEFRLVYDDVEKNWTKQDKLELLLRAIKNYLSNSFEKGCIFYQNKCTCYEHRPLICRFYGVISPQNWNKRAERVRAVYGSNFNVPNQCNLVQTINGSSLSPDDEDRFFYNVQRIEEEVVGKQAVKLHDDVLGSYHSFHDHLLLESFDEKWLAQLTQLKLAKLSNEDIDKFIDNIRTPLSVRE